MYKLLILTMVLFSLPSMASHQVPLLIVSAAQEEAQPTLDALTSMGVGFDYFCVGISIDAAQVGPALQARAAGKYVIYVGSAGTLAPFSRPFLATVSTVAWMPTGQRVGLGTALPSLFPNLGIAPTLFSSSLPSKWLLASPTISYTPEVTIAGLPEASDLLENMEGYFVLSALSTSNMLGVEVIMGVTNQTSPEGHKQWETNAPLVAAMTAEYIVTSLVLLPQVGIVVSIPVGSDQKKEDVGCFGMVRKWFSRR